MPSESVRKTLVQAEKLLAEAQSMPAVQAATPAIQQAQTQALAQLAHAAKLAEYQSLVQYISSRRSVQMTLNVIAMTGSATILGVVLSQAKNIGGVAGWAALIPIPLIGVAWVNLYALQKLDHTTWKRVEEIEHDLGMDGHTWVWDQVNNRLWDKARNISWDFLYLMFAGISLLTAAYLFAAHP